MTTNYFKGVTERGQQAHLVIWGNPERLFSRQGLQGAEEVLILYPYGRRGAHNLVGD